MTPLTTGTRPGADIAPPDALMIAAASLLKGPVYAEEDARTWAAIGTHLAALRDHFRVLGLRVLVDDADRFAYLKTEDELPEGMPRLQRRHTLSKHATVLAVLLRQRLQQAESTGDVPRVVLSGEELLEMMRLYYAEGTSDERIQRSISALEKIGFLRKLSGDHGYEIRRIVKAVINGEWIATFGERLLADDGDEDTQHRSGDAAATASSEDDQ